MIRFVEDALSQPSTDNIFVVGGDGTFQIQSAKATVSLAMQVVAVLSLHLLACCLSPIFVNAVLQLYDRERSEFEW
jgi:hypothetical protein